MSELQLDGLGETQALAETLQRLRAMAAQVADASHPGDCAIIAQSID